MSSIGQSVLSRTRLEQLIREFNLYAEERRHAPLEAVVSTMRQHVEVVRDGDDAFRIAFTGPDPHIVMTLTQRITTLFINEEQRDLEAVAEQASRFLEAMLNVQDGRLALRGRQLEAARHNGSPEAETLAIESEVLEATYKDLSARLEASQLAVDVEQRRMGGRLEVLEPARVAPRPFSPDQRIYAGVGGAAGLAAGLLLSFVILRIRSRGIPRLPDLR
ncbi:MAG: hypothetical protein ABI211_27515 [Vicinamibacterales bacterium]